MTMNEEYYMIMEPYRRREFLDKEKENLLPEEYELLNELFSLRYKAKSRKNNNEYYDELLDLLISMVVEINNAKNQSQFERSGKNIAKKFSKIKLFEFRNKSEAAPQILYNELRQLLRLYISSCEEDRNFTKFFQLIPLTKNYYTGIIENRVLTIDNLCAVGGLDEKLPEFSMACKDEMSVYAEKKEIKSYFRR